MFDEQKKVIEKLATKEETQKWIKTLKDTIYKDLEVYLKRLEFTEFVDRYNKEQKDLETKFKEIDQKFETDKADIKFLKSEVELRAYDEDFQDLLEHSKLFAYTKELEAVESRIFPLLQGFRNEMADFKIERQQHTKVLLRYDEVMSDKASKFSIHELREDIYNNFSKKPAIEELKVKQDLMREDFEKTNDQNNEKFEDINKAITVEIFAAVKKAMKQMAQMIAKA